MIELSIVGFNYHLEKIERGYNNRTLYINLADMPLSLAPMNVLKTQSINDEGEHQTEFQLKNF